MSTIRMCSLAALLLFAPLAKAASDEEESAAKALERHGATLVRDLEDPHRVTEVNFHDKQVTDDDISPIVTLSHLQSLVDRH